MSGPGTVGVAVSPQIARYQAAIEKRNAFDQRAGAAEQAFSTSLHQIRNTCDSYIDRIDRCPAKERVRDLGPYLKQVRSLKPGELRLTPDGRIKPLKSTSSVKNFFGIGRSDRQAQSEALKEMFGMKSAQQSDLKTALVSATARDRWMSATQQLVDAQHANKVAASVLERHGIAIPFEPSEGRHAIVTMKRDAGTAIDDAKQTHRRDTVIQRSVITKEVREAYMALGPEAPAAIEALKPPRADLPDAKERQGLLLFWQTSVGAAFINGHARHLSDTRVGAPGVLSRRVIAEARNALGKANSDRAVVLDAKDRGPAFTKAVAYLQRLGNDSGKIVAGMKAAVTERPKCKVQTLYRGTRMELSDVQALRERLSTGQSWPAPQFMSFSTSESEARTFYKNSDEGVPVLITAEWPGARDVKGLTELEYLLVPGAKLKKLGESFYTFKSRAFGRDVHHFHLIGA